MLEQAELRVYTPGLDEFDRDGYPTAWQTIKNDVRETAGHRCIRCLHPFRVRTGLGEWSPCDERCLHRGPGRYRPGWSELGEGASGYTDVDPWADETCTPPDAVAGQLIADGIDVEARYRILTVHHANGIKADCRWWNLLALCQRCHLTIQGKVVMDRIWPHEHSGWFKSYVAGFYAWRYLREEITREQAEQRMGELLALEVRQLSLEAV